MTASISPRRPTRNRSAASAGVVLGARPNVGYGNWIKIGHHGDLATVYGHLSRFAPGIKSGAWVSQGDLIGYTGNTGRSTGPHLHFELLSDDKPVNPIARPDVGLAQLTGFDLERFEKQVTAELARSARSRCRHSASWQERGAVHKMKPPRLVVAWRVSTIPPTRCSVSPDKPA
jgi:hypothetical protein